MGSKVTTKRATPSEQQQKQQQQQRQREAHLQEFFILLYFYVFAERKPEVAVVKYKEKLAGNAKFSITIFLYFHGKLTMTTTRT